jgi:WS/DGAT/MGAT family acyltransferase
VRDGLDLPKTTLGALKNGAAMLRRPVEARTAMRRLGAAAFSAVRLATREIPELPWNGRLGRRRALSFTRLPLDVVRDIKRFHGGTVNDVVLSVLAGGLRRYLAGLDIEVDTLEVTALVPVNTRGSRDALQLGNRISAMLVPLAVDVELEAARLAATRTLTDRLKKEQSWAGIDALLDLIDGMPAAVVSTVAETLSVHRLANVVATNVPRPPSTRWLCGARVEDLFPIVPIADGLGLGLAVFSYDGTLQVGLYADRDLVPDLDKLRMSIEESFRELASAI